MSDVVKLDLKKDLKHLYNPSRKDFTVVDVPPMNFIMIDGAGNPNTAQEYKDALEALYGVAFPVKFASKKELGIDYVVMPLQGLWWAEDMDVFTLGDKDAWLWTMMIVQPEHITGEMVEAAKAQAAAKKDLPALPKLRFESYHEGLAVQIMHIGPYDAEGPTLARMHDEYIPQNGYTEDGKHHEIYLSDPRRSAPEKMRTVLRQPIRKA
jgi:hypothetical protein